MFEECVLNYNQTQSYEQWIKNESKNFEFSEISKVTNNTRMKEGQVNNCLKYKS